MLEKTIIDIAVSKERQQEIQEKCLNGILAEIIIEFDKVKEAENLNEVEVMYYLVKMGGMLQSAYENKKRQMVLKMLGVEGK